MGVLDRFRLDGRTAVITGGSRGLGRAMAQGLAEAGADLIWIGLRSPEEYAKAADVIKKPLFATIGGANLPATPGAEGLGRDVAPRAKAARATV